MQMYSLFDRSMKEYGSIVLAPNDAVAMRSVQDGVRGSKSTVEIHAEDFDLYQVGDFNQNTGVVDGGIPRFVVNVAVVLAPPSQGG